MIFLPSTVQHPAVDSEGLEKKERFGALFLRGSLGMTGGSSFRLWARFPASASSAAALKRNLNMKKFSSRWRFALGWSIPHGLVTLVVATLSAGLVFGLWYPDPWREMLGVGAIFSIVIAVDMVCGPLLTLLLASPQKSRRELWLDLSLVALIQLAALGYGLWSVFSARPVVLAFEVDRWVLVTANEVDIQQLPTALPGMQSLPVAGLHRVAVREPRSPEERLQSIEFSVQGLTPAMRPGWWIPVEDARAQMDRRAKPLAELIARRPAAKGVLQAAADRSNLPMASLRYLPLTSGKNLDWIALMNDAGDIVGHAQVDGFE